MISSDIVLSLPSEIPVPGIFLVFFVLFNILVMYNGPLQKYLTSLDCNAEQNLSSFRGNNSG